MKNLLNIQRWCWKSIYMTLKVCCVGVSICHLNTVVDRCKCTAISHTCCKKEKQVANTETMQSEKHTNWKQMQQKHTLCDSYAVSFTQVDSSESVGNRPTPSTCPRVCVRERERLILLLHSCGCSILLTPSYTVQLYFTLIDSLFPLHSCWE